ncbi:MAG: hypothetical protein RLZZ621_371 [Gemmatimonadota bacterium]
MTHEMTRVMTAPISFEHVSVWYGDVVAVNDITCHVDAGITGLLGPNGAGKTTLLQLAAGLLPPSSGRVQLFGESPVARPEIFRHVALVPEREALPGMLTPREFVEARATLLGLRDVRGAARAALEQVELDTVATRRIDGFSKGMRQRTKLAAALVHGPRVVLLDEPFNGLDPRQRLHMMRLLEARAAAGTAVLLSSHILEEIEEVAAQILVVLAGRLAASGDYRALRRLMSDRPHTVFVRASAPRQLAAALMQSDTVLGVEIDEAGIRIRTTDFSALSRMLVRAAHHGGITLHEVQPTDESLEHVFAYLVER